MKLALINIAIDKASPPLGLCSIATYVEKYADFQGMLVIDINHDNIMERIGQEKPDVVGISAMTIYYPSAIKLAKQIREKYPNIAILIGGNHISTLPESLAECFDIGVVGEGEETVKELVQLFQKEGKYTPENLKQIKGLVFRENGKLIQTEKRPLISPLDNIPIPNRDYLNKKCFAKVRSFTSGEFEVSYRIPTARGCPYRCKFCSPIVLWGSNTRFHSIDRVAEEVKIGIEKYNATLIKFSDDLFAVSKKRLTELYDKLKEHGYIGKIKFAGTVRANLVDDEMCILLKKLNVVATATGYESGNEKMLNYLKANSVTVKDNYNAIKLLEKYKIPNAGSFIFGSPGETIDMMKDTLKLIKYAYKHKMKFMYIYIMKPFPGTEVWDTAVKRGVVSNDMDWEKLTLFIEGVNDVNKPLMLDPGIDIEEFKKIHDQALMYSRKASIRRFIKTFMRYPIGTMKDIGNPFVFIKKNMLHANTLKILKRQKAVSK